MSKKKVVLIWQEGNNAAFCSILAKNYLGGTAPKVGDIVPFVAKQTYNAVVDGKKKPLEITGLNGLYKVTNVRSGKGVVLHPSGKNPEPWYELADDAEGYGITLGRNVAPLNSSLVPMIAQIEFTL